MGKGGGVGIGVVGRIGKGAYRPEDFMTRLIEEGGFMQASRILNLETNLDLCIKADLRYAFGPEKYAFIPMIVWYAFS